ncbi:thermosome subunit, partial [archaeon]|nr:thermosome subunit [archaeon]
MNKSVLDDNIQAAVILSSIFRSAYGPKGMNKLLVDNIGDTFVTKDGASIIDNIEVKHPVAKLLAEAAETMEEEVGDGSKTAVILAGELLKKAGELVSEGMHPMMIVKGYQLALNKTLRVLDKKSLKNSDKGVVKSLIKTALLTNDYLTETVYEAVKDTSVEDITTLKKRSRGEAVVVNGVVIDKERVHPGMPKKAVNAKILVTKTPLEVRETATSSELEITSPSQLSSLLEKEHESIKEVISSIKKSGADVVLCQKGISDQAQEYLAKNGVIGVRRIREKDINYLLKATDAKLVSDLTTIKPSDLGTGDVYTERVGDERLTFINNCPGGVKTILIRGATEQLIDEVEKSVLNALGVVKAFRAEKSYVPGAGVIEKIISNELLKKLPGGKEQLSYTAFAKALEKVIQALIT